MMGKRKSLPKHSTFQNVLELLDFNGDHSDLSNDGSDLDEDQLRDREPSSSEGSGDEFSIPLPTKERGQKRCYETGSESDPDSEEPGPSSGPASNQDLETPFGPEQTPIEPDSEEPGPSTGTKSNRRRATRWVGSPLQPQLVKFEQDEVEEQDHNEWTPYDYFQQYVDKPLLQMIADCTNTSSLSRTGFLLRTSLEEICHFFGACILMSCVNYPRIRMYWSNTLSFPTLVDRFTRDRFFKLWNSIKVVNDDGVPDTAKRLDTFWKLRPFLDRILLGCLAQTQTQFVSVDEHMVPFLGRCPHRQYLSSKKNPIGIKNFVCATPEGIILNFYLFQGKQALVGLAGEGSDLGLESLVMSTLCKNLRPGTRVYCDHFFTSVQCLELMMKSGIYVTGAVMKSRVAAALKKLPSDLAMQRRGRGSSAEVSSEDGKLAIVKWHDNKPVLMLSAVHGVQPEDTCQRWDKIAKKYVAVSRPCAVREYYANMGGVDLVDRMMGYYRMATRTKKWTMRMLMHFIDLALSNSWLQYRKDQQTSGAARRSIQQFQEFRMEVARSLLCQRDRGNEQEVKRLFPQAGHEDTDAAHRSRKTPVPVPHISSRRAGNAHLPEFVPQKSSSRCRVPGCSGKTRVRCESCKIFLCMKAERNCFLKFHK